ncbi:MAG: ABC transporter ATP-binding protein [Alicyclobacillus macrosporangiidus]|uniref:ABC transporter ATP-binding protein n=1 Tax=Alicyclobacillus macrosporangiidus TaxID=392015 RepID=UPI0026EC27DA|nr:ABC transporter ATP-binding protein [Alicyclobacillus macrosporangiidus]MCL6599172.1 ABC transporter ATP-binding protein [Alicyclobacillus macrosporangiidus]
MTAVDIVRWNREATEPVLVVTGLTRAFGSFYAVRDVSFRINLGEVRAIIGPNGAGKTTLFHLISGYLRPTAGRILLCGQDIVGLPPHRIARLGISRAFQTTNIFPGFSVIENVLVALHARRGEAMRLWRRVDAALVDEAEVLLERVNLRHLAVQPANALSHGDQRALEIAIALAAAPKLLLMDEPTAGMSPYETQRTMELVRDIVQRERLTVLLSEHDMDVVFGLADQITVMEAGRVLAEGRPHEVRENPDVVRAYLGD